MLPPVFKFQSRRLMNVYLPQAQVSKYEKSEKCLLEEKYINACFVGDMKSVMYMIKKEGKSLKSVNFLIDCLNRACDGDNIDVCKAIFQYKDIIKSHNPDNILMHACRTGRLEFVKFYLELDSCDAVISKSTYIPAASFYRCCQSGNVELIKYMLERYRTKEYKIHGLISWDVCMERACESGNIESVRLFFEYKITNWNSCLKSACKGGNIEVVKRIIKKGATQFAQCAVEAGMGGNIEIINLLNNLVLEVSIEVSIDISIEVRAKCDQDYIYGACIAGNLEIIKLMFGRVSNEYINTVCMNTVCRYGYMEIIQFLIEKGATNFDNYILQACEYNKMEVVEFLIEKGASNFNEYLYYVCLNGWTGLAKMLVIKGATDWNRGLSGACKGRHVDIAKLMIDLGATNINECMNNYNMFDANDDICILLLTSGATDLTSLCNSKNFKLYQLGYKYIYKTQYNNHLSRLVEYPPYVLFIGCRLSKGKECRVRRLPVELFTILHKF